MTGEDRAGDGDPAYGWVIVAAGAVITCIAAGAIFSLSVYLQPVAAETGWSRAGISAAMTIGFLALAAAGFFWGMASDRFGTRPVVLAACLLLCLGLWLASRAESLLQFQLCYGVLLGVAGGAFFAPVIAATTLWFRRRRALAVALVSVGMGAAPMTVSPLAGWLILELGWRDAMALTAGLALLVLLPVALLLRRAPAAAGEGEAGMAAAQGGGAPAAPARLGQTLASPAFTLLALTFFLCCAAHSGPIFHVVSYAIHCGIAPMAAVSVYSVEGLAGLGGRFLLGIAADRLGAKPVLVAGLMVQALAIAAYARAAELADFYLLSIVLGAAYGGVMPLYAVLARDRFPPQQMGGVLGAATSISALGMAAGPMAGGWLFDSLGSYAPLYLGSAALGLGAVAIALAFPGTARPRPGLQPA